MPKGGGFPGMGGGNMQQMLKQAQKMQQQIEQLQEELELREYEAASGGGVVTAKINGKKELTSLKIDPGAVDPEDVEMLEDLIMVAVNGAMRKAEEDHEESMSKIAGGKMSGLF